MMSREHWASACTPVQGQSADDGFAVVPGLLDHVAVNALLVALGPVIGAGNRGILSNPNVTDLANSKRMLDLVRPHLASEPKPVRAIYFDKSTDTNWLVAWHQDLTLAVGARAEVTGFGPWSIKQGVTHVQPPVALLEQMLTLRIHLDDADLDNGCLRVLPGTHCLGRLSAEEIHEAREQRAEEACVVSVGDVLLMRPLLLHASGRSAGRRHRRILHIEYAGFALPSELQWHEPA